LKTHKKLLQFSLFASKIEPATLPGGPVEMANSPELNLPGPAKDAVLRGGIALDRLKLIIPDVEDTSIETTHDVLEIWEAVHVVAAVVDGTAVGALLGEGALGFLVEVGGPVAGAAAVFVALGISYTEERKAIAEENLSSGFSRGAVMGGDQDTFTQTKDYFYQWEALKNDFDEAAGKVAQNAYNAGLYAGWVQGNELSKNQRAFLWTDLGRAYGGDVKAEFGESSDRSKNDWVNFYIAMAATLRKNYLAG
jgi:hypothetical protein